MPFTPGLIARVLTGSLLTLLAINLAASTTAQEKEPKSQQRSAEALAVAARPSVVVITAPGREANEQGVGTGFIVSSDGLLVSNLHVVGEGRPISVQTADGRELVVKEVFASDHVLDLVILRVDPGKKPLNALPLAEQREPREGEPVVVMGNPLGLKHSVVSGVISGTRDVDERRMLQLAIPIEPGNSGGPVLDAQGAVIGIVTLKSAVSRNLGFAVSVDDLRLLLDKPNPVPWKRWLTIGRLDQRQWSTLFGARWTQRGGQILVSEPGKGFGGRALCLQQTDPPQVPFEVAVQVRLDDESGAAGLVVHADGGDRHYGFYPSNGRLRMSRFDGPVVFNWNVLQEVETPHYRPGEWNHLKVRVEKNKLLGYVNDQLVIESSDDTYTAGKIGLAKFRDTKAHFKHFRAAAKIPGSQPSRQTVERVGRLVQQLPAVAELTPETIQPLAAEAEASRGVLEARAAALERQAAELRLVASDVRVQGVISDLKALVKEDSKEIDLLRAALLIAKLDGEDVDVEAYVDEVEQMARRVRDGLPKNAEPQKRLAALNQFLFRDNGYHGSRFDYYHRANSYLNRVIDDRVGLPISLSLLYMELGQRLGLNLHGVGLPGHFIVKHAPPKGESQLIDVFDQGRILSREDAAKLVQKSAGIALTEEHLESVTGKDIVYRMLLNLRRLAEQKPDRESILRYLHAALVIRPDDAAQRGMRAVVQFETGRKAAAVADLDWFLKERPAGFELEKIRQMRDFFLRK